MKITGKVWKFGDDVNTDEIIPAEYLTTGDAKELAKHAFEKVRPEFAKNVKDVDVIVAGKNFGSGSSREHAPRALKGCGVSCVIARSFARIYFRNSINIALPAVECSIDADEGDTVEVDFSSGKIKNLTKNKEYEFHALPPFLQNIFDAGGLVNYVKAALKND